MASKIKNETNCWGAKVVLGLAVLAFMGLPVSTYAVRDKTAPPTPTLRQVLKEVDRKSAPVTVYPIVEGRSLVTWDTLAHFRYDTPDIDEEIDPNLRLKKKKFPIPKFVKKLNGENIAAVGFMIPVQTD